MKDSAHAARTLVTAALPVAALSLCAPPAAGQSLTESRKLTASDAEFLDTFGESVSISDGTAIVGALRNGLGGSAYLFDISTGQQLLKLTASDAQAADAFGISVAISGTTAVVGARSDDDLGNASGSAYIFDLATGQQLFKLRASDGAGGDWFGRSVAISGTRAVVGAPATVSSTPGREAGAAYVFDTTTGQQLFKLVASDGAADDEFGISVGISGSTAIVGAYSDDDAGSRSGSAYLFDITTGMQLFKLTAPELEQEDRFGISVAISGSTAIVGAINVGSGFNSTGAAYVFDAATGERVRTLTASDPGLGDSFGGSVAIFDTTAVVGASGNNDAGGNSGSAYAFDITTGQQLYKMTASDAEANDVFGISVAVSGSTAIVGASGNSDAGDGSGSAYLLDLTSCQIDWDVNSVINIFDVIAFLGTWNAGLPSADFNKDNSVNVLDVSAFITAWNQGCP